MIRIANYFYTSEIYIVRITFDIYISTSHSLIAISYRPSPLQFKSSISLAIHCFSKIPNIIFIPLSIIVTLEFQRFFPTLTYVVIFPICKCLCRPYGQHDRVFADFPFEYISTIS